MRPEPRRADLTERMIYLRSIPVAAALSPPVLRQIAAALRERHFPAGTVLMREGEPIDAMHLLTAGKVFLSRGGKPIGHLKPPQSLGFLGILARSEGTYDATVDEDVRSFELEADTLLELLEDHFELMFSALRYVGERLYYDLQELPQAALGMPFDEHPIEVPDRPLDLVERLLFLRRQSAFANASLNGLTDYAKHLREVRLGAGEKLWDVGDPSGQVTLLVKGVVFCRTADGREFRYGPGTGIGGADTLAQLPRWYSVTAETPIVSLVATMDATVDLFQDNFPMAMHFLSALSSGLIRLTERKALLGQNPLDVKRKVSQLGAVPVGA